MAFHCQVFLEEVTAAQLKAEVDDGRPRRVTLAWTGLELLYSCTCPRYTTTLACCRHVWATLHEADCVEEALRAVSATQVRLSPRDRQPRGPGLDPARARAGIPEAGAEVLYVLDRQKILARGELVLSFCTRGTGRLGGTRELTAERDHDHDPWILGRNERDAVLPLLVETRRLHYRDRRNAELRPLAGDKGTAWEFRMTVRESGDGKQWEVHGVLVRGEDKLTPSDPWLVLSGGWLIAGGKISRLQDHGAFPWLSALRRDGTFRVPRERESELLERLWKLPGELAIEWPEAMKLREERFAPRPLLRVMRGKSDHPGPAPLRATLCFLYDEELVEYANPAAAVPEVPRRRLLVRDLRKEAEHRGVLGEHGVSAPPLDLVRAGTFSPLELTIAPDALPGAVRGLTARGWQVEAEGKIYRPGKRFHLHVSSGIDWFDLEVDAVFGETVVPFPRLLKAVERGKDFVVLDDGSRGILPETWIGEYRLLLAMGRLRDGRLRFLRSQLAILDRLVSTDAGASWDRDFGAARAAFADLERILPEEPGADFRVELRPYQKEGLGWLRFLERAGLGGCLADDMGLGKTVQVLASLAGRRDRCGDDALPSLSVVPRSLVFNWISEARRFTPGLRVLEHHGARRVKDEAPG